MSSALSIVQKFYPGVTEVVDAKRPARIEVLNSDATKKGVKNHEACAMAQACKRQLGLDGVIISRSTAYLVKGKKARRFKLAPSVSREVVSFDRGAGFAPGTYQLSAIPAAMRFGARPPHGGGSGTETGQGDKRLRHLTTGIRAVLGGANTD